MPRPRIHDPERLLDVAERLVAERGPEEVTVRALALEAGVPNSTIYHSFGSLPALVGRAWLRGATHFLDVQENLVDEALAGDGPIAAVVAAADAPAVVAGLRPDAARLMITVSPDRVLGPQLPAEVVEALHALDKRMVRLLVRLARELWQRGDGAAVEVITACVVDLPTALLRRELVEGRVGEGSRRRLAAAVRAVLALPPPKRRPSRTGRST
ncbi:TetR/AcrR family transcriptional regulator [Amycolatopsis sp. FDAARGOS 1241]|uniref:TetR/AcrR family transcriptional regulator n=1 Tax=Amycolatopsis sp. FDAARGOS 1241 TaxID=2778070 RepID=UPI00195096D2|nr:TetR/AcrR family transcriptional regulator [Amycolatopsis sp. FDAARGOS 1241]QRP49143.1 TetR/AcrR family transcriptional regulator [Amycolatopsis sp. FDAARGOS 1241]